MGESEEGDLTQRTQRKSAEFAEKRKPRAYTRRRSVGSIEMRQGALVATVPPLRSGKRRRCSGREDNSVVECA
jgi:hypothetical protein